MGDATNIECPKCGNLNVKINQDGTIYCKICGYIGKAEQANKKKTKIWVR